MANINIAAAWMVTARPPISISSRPFIKPLGIVPSASITIGIVMTTANLG